MARYALLIGLFLMIGGFAYMLHLTNTGEYNSRDIPTEFIGRTAPAINVPGLYNETEIVKTSDMLGQVWLLNVWGTWCPECWREHDFLMQLKRNGIPIVGLNWRDTRPEAKAMLTKLGDPFVKIGFDPESAVAIDWGVYGAPETFLINAEGVILAKHAGGITPTVWAKKFKRFFEKSINASVAK